MGRRSPEGKKKKQACQKAKRKLCFSTGSAHSPSDDTSSAQPEETESTISDACGEDADIVEMNMEDALKRLEYNPGNYTQEYLTECGVKLMKKVTQYRKQLEDSKTDNIRLAYQHRQEIEHIRSFYRTLMHAPSTSARIVKAGLSTSDVATKLMKELGLKYKYDGDSYVVYK